ncbi:MAG: DNA methyltransferase [Pseudomonadota bacterium]
MSPSTASPHPAFVISDIVHRVPKDLVLWPNNPRRHSQKQITQLCAAIKTYGFTVPILIDESNTILGGHGRLSAAFELNLPTVPVRVITGLTQAQKRAYVIADNKLASISSWDDVNLRSELELLIQDDFDIELTAFSTAEIDLMFEPTTPGSDKKSDSLQDADASPDVITKPGDLWLLGQHKLLCADALERSSFEQLLGEERIQLSIVDYPYNVKISEVVGNGTTKHSEFAMASGEMSPAQFTAFLQKALSLIHQFSADGALSYGFMDWKHMREIQDGAKPDFGDPKQLIVWAKQAAGMGTHYRSQHELVFLFKKGQAAHINNFGLGQHGRFRTNVWSYPSSQQFKDKSVLKEHPTPKPVALIADALRDSSHRKGIVLDSFAGSGTILIAAERTGRHARAMELEPRYCDTGIRRWQRIFGKQASLASTGQTWDEVHAERLAAKAEGELS